jgi:HEAT repeat protein
MKRALCISALLFLAASAWTTAQQDPARDAFSRLDAAVKANDAEKGEAALKELTAMGAKALPECERRLKVGYELLRGFALQVLFGMGEAAAPALPAVLKASQDPSELVRGSAAWTLSRIDRSPETVKRLAALLKDKSRVVRWKTAEGLKSLGQAAEPALPALVEVCAADPDPEETARSYACGALGGLRTRPDLCLPALIKALEPTATLSATLSAVGALAEFRSEARPAVPALVRILNEAAAQKNTWLGHDAAVALARIGGPEARAALPALEQLQGMADAVNTREDLADAIYKIGAIKPAPGAAPEKPAPPAPAPRPGISPAAAPPVAAAPAPGGAAANLPDVSGWQTLPPDGGEPGKAYLALCQALQKNDPEALRGLGMAELKLPADQLQMMLKGMAAVWPMNPKILKGFVQGDRALLHVTGVRWKTTVYGAVEMEKRPAGWVVANTPFWDDKPLK